MSICMSISMRPTAAAVNTVQRRLNDTFHGTWSRRKETYEGLSNVVH